jgi:hypothetical protein
VRVKLPDGTDILAPTWLAIDLRNAVAANLAPSSARAQETMRELLDAANRRRDSRVASRMAATLRERIPYRYDGDARHRIASLDDVHARNFGACADGAAAVAAALILTGGLHRGHLCCETVEGEPQYSHARVYVDAAVVEPWPEFRRPEANGCTLFVDVLELLPAR